MSSSRNIGSVAAILFGLLGASLTTAALAAPQKEKAAPPISQARDHKVWAELGSGNGKLAHYKPAHPPGYYDLGRPATPAEIAGWTIAITPAGEGLPPGKGTVDQGSTIYASNCAMCHGTFGEGANSYPALAGGVGSLASAAPEKTVGSYWPYAPVVWDYINRAMPFYAPHTLKPDQVYALTAFILNLSNVVPDNFVADAKSLAAVKMPNRDGYDWKDPRPVTHNVACMKNCADPASIKVTSDAASMNLTPRLTGPLDTMSNSK